MDAAGPRSRYRVLAAVAVLLCLLAGPAAADPALSGHGGAVRSVAVSADGGAVLTGGFDYTVMLWDAATGRPTARLVGHEAPVTAVAFLPGGRALSASDDGSLIVWSLADGAMLHRLSGHAGRVAGLALAPDGDLAASAGWDGTVRLWDPGSGTALARLDGHDGPVNAVAFSPDGRLLASGGQGSTILLWEIAERRRLRAIDGHDFAVNALAFAADGRLVSASGDATIRVWSVPDGVEQITILRHEAPVLALALAPDGDTGASTSATGGVVGWQRADGALTHGYDSGGEVIWSLAFAPDGSRLYGAGGDGSVRIWRRADGAAIGTLAAAPPEPLLVDDSRGAVLFRKCQACHSLTAGDGGRAGPTFQGLMGRRAGSVAGYPYSAALRDSDIVWTADAIAELFEIGPEAMTPGSKMPLQRIPDPADRAALVDFLRRHAGSAPAR